MSKSNNGLEFELLTERIFKAISGQHDDVSIHRNVSLKGIDGERQIDLLITSKFAGIEFRTIVECKDYNKKIDVKVIDGFHSVMQDVSAHKGVVVSRKGFSSTAIAKAKRLGISLFSAHQANSEKWELDLELPMLLTEARVASIVVNPTIKAKKGTIIKQSAINVINDVDLVASFIKNWNETPDFLDSHFIYQNDRVSLKVGSLKPPFYVRDSQGDPVEVTDYELIVDFDKRYYFSYIHDVTDSLLLKCHSGDDSTMILPSEVFSNYHQCLKLIDKSKISLPPNSLVKMALVKVKASGYSAT
ncbi:restriction endonuclease [Vibrio vulnificus]|uniref:restriction endonuclease n=1 Tax=Vibrio vulnificus TaxID=672 RepID=UPI00102AA6D6|nr:restriction endonuclease [Vibrio vulnificus]EIE1227809.1 restriction endonuclease [Vibrio vulnificus]EJS4046533.1 restriction endonuclease [Vibrio vulnificus]RZQ82136.1 restriction endonuclease [Vibrio vulnificus]HDY8127853.1 restriction endonuclease [Vibrio vulnificus]HDZ3276620.1 restriction endonuclease [Vibrio vulnificus]